VSPEKSAKTNRINFTQAIWNFFTSLKLVIFLFLILSALSIAGTVIEQNKPLHEYYRYYTPETVIFFNKIGLLDMYHSWWFISCLVLLALNIIACTMDRYAPIMSALRKKYLILDETLEKSLNPKATIKYLLPLDTVEKKVVELAGKSFNSRPIVTHGQDGSRYYFFEKGKYTRLAFFFIHLSVLLIFFGALLGSIFGYKGYLNLCEGESASSLETRSGQIKNLFFTIKCNSFAADFYPNGAPKDYRSDLSIILAEKEVMRKTIRVNDPLTFRGLTFYQASYGSRPERVILEVLNQGGTQRGIIEVPFSQRIDIPGTNDQVEAVYYHEHFHLSDGSKGGTLIGINFYPEKGEPTGVWLIEDYPDHDKLRQGAYYFQLNDLRLKRYTGLQVKKDPGVWAVWLGSFSLISGIMVALFMSHKKLWVCLRKDKQGRTNAIVGGMTNKNRNVFAREIEGIIQSLREIS
jgi:cytochrome c biogenesis protein